MVFRDLSLRNPLYQFRDEMDRLFTGFFGPVAEGAVSTLLRGQPAVNLWEQDDAVMVEMEVPGVQRDQIDLSVVGRELTIHIDRPEVVQENVVCHRCERPVGKFSRTLPLPCDINTDRVAANLQDGVLTITLPKAEIAKPRKITVA